MTKELEQIVTFKVGNEAFGLTVLDVNEVIIPSGIQAITTNKPYITGVINLRGQIINIVDFGLMLGKIKREAVKKPRIVIISNENGKIGLLVDEVTHVTSARDMEFDEPPKNASLYIVGVGKYPTRTELVYMIETYKLIQQVEGG